MSLSDFNKNTQKKLSDYRPDIDAEALWQDLEPQLHPRKKRRGLIFWFFIGLGVLGTSGLCYGLWSSAKGPLPTTNATSLPMMEQNTVAESSTSEAKNTATNSIEIEAEEDTKITSPQRPISPAANQASVQAKAGDSPTILPADPTMTNIAMKSTSTLVIENSSPTPEAPKSDDPRPRSEPKPPTQNVSSSLPAFLPLALKEQLLFWDWTEAWVAPLRLAPLPDETLKNTSEEEKESPWRLGLGIGIGLGQQHLKAQNSAGLDYLALRKSSETALEILNGEVYLKWQHPQQNWYVQTGFNFMRLASRFDWSGEMISYSINPNGLQRIEINTSTGDTTMVYGPTPQKETVEFSRIRYGKQDLFQIPLSLGYVWKQNAWSFGVEAGAVLNIRVRRKGIIAGEQIKESSDMDALDFYDLSTDEDDWFKTQGGLGWMTGIRASYTLPSGLEIYAAPRFQFPMKFSTDQNPIQERWSTLSLGLGLEYHF